MDLEQVHALRAGPANLPDGEPAEVFVRDHGALLVRSGRLGIAEALRLEHPLVVSIPPGEYPVRTTMVRLDESYAYPRERFAYLSLVLGDAPATAIGPARIEAESLGPRDTPAGGLAGVPGLHGVRTTLGAIGVFDADALIPGMPENPATWERDVLDESVGLGWFAQMDTQLPESNGTLNAVMPRAVHDENIVLSIAPSDASLPVLAATDAAGGLVAIHIDLLALGELVLPLGALRGPTPDAAAMHEEDREDEARRLAALAGSEEPRPGFLRTVFRRWLP